MVEKEAQLAALDIGELDMYVQTMEPWHIESVGNQAYVPNHLFPYPLFSLKLLNTIIHH